MWEEHWDNIVIYSDMQAGHGGIYGIGNVYAKAGYDNVLIPEYGYRTNFFYGWTEKERLFLDAMRKFWDEKDAMIRQ